MPYMCIALYLLGMIPMFGMLTLYSDHPARRSKDRNPEISKSQLAMTCFLWPLASFAILVMKEPK